MRSWFWLSKLVSSRWLNLNLVDNHQHMNKQKHKQTHIYTGRTECLLTNLKLAFCGSPQRLPWQCDSVAVWQCDSVTAGRCPTRRPVHSAFVDQNLAGMTGNSQPAAGGNHCLLPGTSKVGRQIYLPRTAQFCFELQSGKLQFWRQFCASFPLRRSLQPRSFRYGALTIFFPLFFLLPPFFFSLFCCFPAWYINL